MQMNVLMLLTGVAIEKVALCFGPFGELCYLSTEMIHASTRWYMYLVQTSRQAAVH